MSNRLVLGGIYFLLFTESASAALQMKSYYPPKDETAYPEPVCGIDYTGSTTVNEGTGKIEDYPWLGNLVFPLRGIIHTMPVILITKQLALSFAAAVASLPKIDFRARAKIILGHNCTGPRYRVKEYSYHPDFEKKTYSSFALLQLDVVKGVHKLHPICPPPAKIEEANFYAVSLSSDCYSSKINIMQMKYVDPKECKTFYRRSQLDMESIWPKYTVCAKALRGGHCVWEAGVALVMKKGDRWMLAGFGVSGPGCEAPSRFLEYGMYHQWVRQSVERIGMPAITRIAQNEIIMRRQTSSIQKFGPCDPEEKYVEIYTDHTAIFPGIPTDSTARYNFSIFAQYEYSCIIFSASQPMPITPSVHLRRLCLSTRPSCYQFSTLQVDFEVAIVYRGEAEYRINVFGQPLRTLDIKAMNKYYNRFEEPYNVSVIFQPVKY